MASFCFAIALSFASRASIALEMAVLYCLVSLGLLYKISSYDKVIFPKPNSIVGLKDYFSCLGFDI